MARICVNPLNNASVALLSVSLRATRPWTLRHWSWREAKHMPVLAVRNTSRADETPYLQSDGTQASATEQVEKVGTRFLSLRQLSLQLLSEKIWTSAIPEGLRHCRR